jgi:predicted AAA+ superfamily ATPase
MIRDIAKSENRTDMIRELLLYTLALLITTFLIRILWNRSLVKHITVLKPINTLSDAFILSIALSVVRGL